MRIARASPRRTGTGRDDHLMRDPESVFKNPTPRIQADLPALSPVQEVAHAA
jgi:hypothetical protein